MNTYRVRFFKVFLTLIVMMNMTIACGAPTAERGVEAETVITEETVEEPSPTERANKSATINPAVQGEPGDVYNMSVDGTQTYFANDFAVHNKYIWRPTCTNSVSPATPQLLCKNDGVGIGTNYRLTCDQYFPSLMATGDAWCYTGCTCCAATDTLACTTGANYTREAADISCANKYDIYVSVESRLTERVSA